MTATIRAEQRALTRLRGGRVAGPLPPRLRGAGVAGPAVLGLLGLLGLVATGCGRSTTADHIQHPTSAPRNAAGAPPGLSPVITRASAPTPASVPTSPPTTATTIAPTATPTATPTPGAAPFPAVIVDAMSQFRPLPAGAEAPHDLPTVPGYLTAQTGGLGGQDNVTLIVTARPLPVDSPALASAGAGQELASFATTPTASVSDASASLAQARSQSIDSCGGPSHRVALSGGTTALSCPTVDGAALTWDVGSWVAQVVTLSGTAPSMGEAEQVEADLERTGLPASEGGGIISVVVPGSPSAGSADTAAVEWVGGADVYQVRSADDPPVALAVAGAMRPYPG